MYTVPTAPADCFAALGAMDSSLCPITANPTASEGRILIMSEIDSITGLAKYKPTDYTLIADWDAVIDNAGAGAKMLYGVGDRPRADGGQVTVGGITMSRKKRRLYNFGVNQNIDTLNTYLRTLQHGWEGVIWWVNKDATLFGGPEGVHVNLFSCEDEEGQGDDALYNWLLNFEFFNKISPPALLNGPFTPRN